MQTFLIIWAGQLVSLLGTGMTRFALMIWAWQQTGEATTLALLGFCSYGPYVVVSPLAGIVVDRFDRRRIMMIADLLAGLMTISLLLLLVTGCLEIWHLYVAEAFASAFEAFQIPAYSASITMLVPKKHYARANGMKTLARSTSTVFAPMFAGALLLLIGLKGIMLIDVVTFLAAIGTLLFVHIPRPTGVSNLHDGPQSKWAQLSLGARYIFARKGLFGLLLIFSGINLIAALTYFSILPALILARTGSNQVALAAVESALGAGGVVGGLLVSLWGGPKRRIHACLGGATLSFLLGDFVMGTGRSVPVWVVAAFVTAVFIPFINSAEQSIWQSKVAPDVQGRVFATKSTLQVASMPIGMLLGGLLADHLFEPAMAVGGLLAAPLGWLVGTGPGAGIGLMFVCTCILGTAMSLSGYLFRAVRRVESDLPDHGHDVTGDAQESPRHA